MIIDTPHISVKERAVKIMANEAILEGNLSIPEGARGIVVFAHGSGSSRFSPRNQFVAQGLHLEHYPFITFFDAITLTL